MYLIIQSFRKNITTFGLPIYITKPFSTTSASANFGKYFKVASPALHKHATKYDIPVVQYNILSSQLSPPHYFSHCDPEDLDPPTRLARICDKLQTHMMRERPIICLQEISRAWDGQLHLLFQKNQYHLITSLYGNKFDGYMGVGIAYPIDEYEALNIDISCLSDTVQWPPRKHIAQKSLFSIFFKRFMNIFGRTKKRPFDPWTTAKRRKNTIISVRLRHKKSDAIFCAGTYHMPCIFGSSKKRGAVVILTSLLSNYMHNFAQSDPYFLAGDFNFHPGDSSYRLLTDGNLDQNDPDLAFLQDIEGGEKVAQWSISSIQKLRSVYVLKNNVEPPFTNKVKVGNSPPFIGTLDYIFCSPEWKVNSVVDLPQEDQIKGYLPNNTEPSDHLLIGVKLQLE